MIFTQCFRHHVSSRDVQVIEVEAAGMKVQGRKELLVFAGRNTWDFQLAESCMVCIGAICRDIRYIRLMESQGIPGYLMSG